MAVVNVKSSIIANRDSTPPFLNDGRYEKGNLVSSIGLVTINNGDTAGVTYNVGSTYVMASVPSSANIRNVLVTTNGITNAIVSLGVARNTRDSLGNAYPVAISAFATGFFSSSLALASPISKGSYLNHTGSNTPDKQVLPIWQALGMASDPNTTLDIVALLTSGATSQGLLLVEVQYCDNSN